MKKTLSVILAAVMLLAAVLTLGSCGKSSGKVKVVDIALSEESYAFAVSKEDAELHMDGRTLTLKTHAKHQNPAGFKQVAAEFERANYAISAELPEMADQKAMTARLENGVLTVTIKKRAETQPKRIEIQ